MYGNTMDGSLDNEAVKIANAFKPFWKKWMKEWGRNCVRSKKMTVTTVPSILTGRIGVTDAFSDTECMIPFQMNVANAQVGDTVWVKWMYDNQQTMYAENMGDIKTEQGIQSGVQTEQNINAGETLSIQVAFEKPFKMIPVVNATLTSSQSVETGLCSVRVFGVSETGFTIGIQNNSQYARTLGASWIATGIMSDAVNLIVEQSSLSNQLYIY